MITADLLLRTAAPVDAHRSARTAEAPVGVGADLLAGTAASLHADRSLRTAGPVAGVVMTHPRTRTALAVDAERILRAACQRPVDADTDLLLVAAFATDAPVSRRTAAQRPVGSHADLTFAAALAVDALEARRTAVIAARLVVVRTVAALTGRRIADRSLRTAGFPADPLLRTADRPRRGARYRDHHALGAGWTAMAVTIGSDATGLIRSAAEADRRIAAFRFRRTASLAAELGRRTWEAAVRSADRSRRTADIESLGRDADAVRRTAHPVGQRWIGYAGNTRRTTGGGDAAADRGAAAGFSHPAADRVVAAELVGGTLTDEERGPRTSGQQPAERRGADRGTDEPEHLAS